MEGLALLMAADWAGWGVWGLGRLWQLLKMRQQESSLHWLTGWLFLMGAVSLEQAMLLDSIFHTVTLLSELESVLPNSATALAIKFM